jgi:hypothetical protein
MTCFTCNTINSLIKAAVLLPLQNFLRGTSSQINIQMEDKDDLQFYDQSCRRLFKGTIAFSLKYIKEFNAKKNLIKNEFIY